MMNSNFYNHGFYYPYGLQNFSRVESLPKIKTYIRILHASPDAPAVDIYANGTAIARNLSYKNFTPYISVPSGSYEIKIYPAGSMDKAVFTEKIELNPNSIYTIAAVNTLDSLQILPILEPATTSKPNFSMLRFSNLSPNAPTLDLTYRDNTKLFKNVEFQETTSYIPVVPKDHWLEIRDSLTDRILLTIPSVKLLPNKFYTIYTVGLLNSSPPLQILVPLDGASYLKT
ncbi:DUF4397 domain-containing protein [Clostridium sp. MSJ-4]|uniref:DUF4397 domain-containing protein n=1 Tax=Clostridium simiarum TaxID=2841506 RepID=A0ABS6F533_9CLOT|nr:DUF4397 domain-containing protein [Clostridium simiarum]MBU5592910.1 DUF4397 domain-containing protein [Clostridium simiarum]